MMFILITTVLLLSIHQGQCGMNATVYLHPDNAQGDAGTLIFSQENADEPVYITGSVYGLNASSAHGFHIHVNPVEEDSPNCTTAGPHFNPYDTPHGPPSANIENRHVGDLGNLTTDENGQVELNTTDIIIQLYNATQSIIDRTVVIHLLRDDGGQGGFNDSQTTGNAGARIICGLIKLASENTTTTTTIEPFNTTTTIEPFNSTTTIEPFNSTTTIEPFNTTTEDYNSTTTGQTTPHSAGLHIKPMIFVFIITIILSYIISY